MKSTTHHALAWGLVWKDSKGFLILTKFRGASSHFRFDLFYIVDLHSAFSQPGHVIYSAPQAVPTDLTHKCKITEYVLYNNDLEFVDWKVKTQPPP